MAPIEKEIDRCNFIIAQKISWIEAYRSKFIDSENFKEAMSRIFKAEADLASASIKLQSMTCARSRGEDPLIWKLSKD